MFFSSHILQDAEMICDRVAILVGGRLRQVGRLRDLVGERIRAWEVTVHGGGEALPGRLLSRRGAETLWQVGSEEELARLLAQAERAGGRLVSLTPQRETLEEVFLRQVQGAGGEDAGPERPAAAAGGGS